LLAALENRGFKLYRAPLQRPLSCGGVHNRGT
jgi:hypothetical protein